ncbi:uncharacterized protein LOC116253512 isoform X2 [Nymphaea colorata]|uniref:uncharacterized protein LOC116253512 isoform X2 n=1 Tax=Nymphaea colorata TaxID=210225 RepID=UPI00129D6AAC|nr:uncharacterized protein LOC116253512 isoform X2 [Nymphaea colorata]
MPPTRTHALSPSSLSSPCTTVALVTLAMTSMKSKPGVPSQTRRSQFERAQNEALDESAEWRMKYDEEVQRSGKYLQELVRVREELEKKIEETEKSKSDLAVLQKEKQSLHKRTESLLHELQSVKMKCHI